MDVDYYNSSPESQMDLMAMMMEMEKLSEVSEQTPSINLSSGPVPPFCNTLLHTLPSPVLSKPPTSPSILGSTAQDTLPTPPMASVTMPTQESMAAAMRETVFRMAAMQPVNIDPELVKPRKRRNVRISTDPQSVAARHRRERISERIRILQRLVPGGTKMDTASMLDEAIHYVKFLKNQVQSLERAHSLTSGFSHPATYSYSCHGFVNHR